uniref:mRNA cap guanine-N(7) methyltransferase n=1 Tax=Strigamia maritima TaxID=126957 RepID=T1IYW9_STRMM
MTPGAQPNCASGVQNQDMEKVARSVAHCEIKFLKMSEIGVRVAEHYNSLQEKGLEERTKSRIFYLRNFNNWIKSMLIGDILQKVKADGARDISVLDIGCGKGGDLLKWKKGDISHLVCTDIAGTSIEQCQQRFDSMNQRRNFHRHNFPSFSAEFITADSTKTRLKSLYKKENTFFNIVSCQFAFHYCFESYSQVDQMLQNASECLKPGGYFIGSTTDSCEIVKRLKASDDLSYGNDVYRITFNEKDKFSLFGAQYNFHLTEVVDCPEFLVYFPALIEIAKKYDLEFVFKTRFDDYFNECTKNADSRKLNDARQLLGRMQALETFPPFEEKDLASALPEDYKNAKDELEKLQSEGESCRKIGTLSLAEWEAATLYVVFAFRKLPKGVKRKRDDIEDSEEQARKQ